MGALPKRRISTGRKGRRRQDKQITSLDGRGKYVTTRERRAAKKNVTEQE
jgi:hypothetical protein